MNVLILTGKFGYGHMSAAYSVREKILSEGDNKVEVVDLIEYLFPRFNKYIYKIFNVLASKCSCVYNFLNKYASKSTSAPLKSVMKKKIERLLEERSIDLIISVLPICSQYIGAYKKTSTCTIPFYTIITDVDVHREWLNEFTSKYFVACKETKDYLISQGVLKEKIVVSGIPVRKNFFSESFNKSEILIMGGGLGLIPKLEKFLSKLDSNSDILVNVILGNNQKLYNKLKNKYKNINLVGFTNDVNVYMNRANLVISKAGGITMSEAIKSETPILCFKPFLAQEEGNAKYIECKGIGKVIRSRKNNIYSDIIDMLGDEIEIKKMKSNMRKINMEYDSISFEFR